MSQQSESTAMADGPTTDGEDAIRTIRDALAVLLLDVATCEDQLNRATRRVDLPTVFRRMRAAVHRAASAAEVVAALADAAKGVRDERRRLVVLPAHHGARSEAP
jgi:hypothetical protein